MPPRSSGFFFERRELMGMGGVGKKKENRMAELALERLENASVAGTDFRAKRQPKETKANREEFEWMRLQLREMQPDFDTQLGLLMAETFFVVKTIAQVKVLERLKMEGWLGYVFEKRY